MTSPVAAKRPLAFLQGGGEMGERMRAFDWASTPLGAPEAWPAQLKAAVRLLLSTRHPMLLWWGPQLIQLYNDAYSDSVGPQRHPNALGQRGHECWEDIWSLIGPQIEQVMQARGGTCSENERVPVARDGVGKEVYWTYSYSPIDEPDAPHGVGGVLAMCTKTGEQTAVRQDHLAERDQLKELFQQAPGFMALLRGPQHLFEMVNPAYMQLVGNHDLLGKTVADALPDTVKQGYVDLLDEVYRSGKAFTTTGARFDFAGANARRVERYVDFVYQPITDAEGAVTGIFMEGFDVTGAHSDAEAVRELYDTLEQRVADAVAERNILADVVEFSETHTMAIDLCYYVLAVNKSYSDEFESLYGHRPKVGDNLLEMLKDDPVRGERTRGFWNRAINGEDFHISETFSSAAIGTRHYDMHFNALKDRSGKRVGAFVVVYDMTDRASEQARLAEAEARVQQAQKIEAIGQLTGGVAHDFNNLLMVISGGLEVMDELAPARREKVIAGMRQAVEKGAGLSRQLLAFSRRQPLRPEAVNLARKIGGMREMLDRSLRGDVHVEVAFDSGLWPVEVDPGQLELVVLNLAVNARDAMPGGGTIRIGARNAPALNDEELFGDYVELYIADTGTGMMPEVLARVFEPFFTTKEIGKGSGLGLAQAHGFAKASRGTVRIESEPRTGTTVFLYLPRTDKSPAGDEEKPEAEAPGRSQVQAQGSLLLVEDDDEVAALTGEMLAALGYEVTRVENADAALGALADGKPFGVVFSDVMMPGHLDGIDLSQEIRARCPGLPVVLTTGHVEAAKQKAEALGLSVLPKPYRLQELETALGEARKQAQDTSPA